MRKIIICSIILCHSISVYSKTIENDEKYKYCKTLDAVAEVAMKKRQYEVPMVEVFNSTLDVKPKESKEMIQLIIKEAYIYPVYNSDRYKQKAITEFRSKIFRQCLSNI